MESIGAWRGAKRAELLAAREQLSAEEHARASAAIERQLESHAAELRGGVVAAYWPIRREFDPLPFAARLIAAGSTIALPVVVGKGAPLEFRAWRPGAAMETAALGLAHPRERTLVDPQALLVPLVGFDDAGYRLGYGAGYYDLTLAALGEQARAIGIGFELGRLATIRPQPHDVRLHGIVTEAGWRSIL